MGWVMGLMRNRGGMSAVAARFVGGHFSAGIAFAAIVILLFSPRALFGETREREVSMTVRYKQAKRLLVLVVGTTVLLLGLVLLVLPGPGLITIALGLSILASECVWARQMLASGFPSFECRADHSAHLAIERLSLGLFRGCTAFAQHYFA